MFASVLREVTGYLDRRLLVSAFFPTLVFAGLATLPWLGQWQDRPDTTKIVLTVGFVAAVVFLTFIAGNLSEWLFRVGQGFWPKGRVTRLLIERQRNRRAKLIERDEELRPRDEDLEAERAAFPRASDFDADKADSRDGDWVDHELAALKALRATRDWPAGTSARLCALGCVLVARPEWTGRVREFTALMHALDEDLETVRQDVREQRAQVQQTLFLWYPQPPRDVLPTRLGNIMRAAEQHPSLRYQLDAVVLWTRLQPLLPKEFADSIRDARVSVDLLLTTAAYVPLVGIPLVWWLNPWLGLLSLLVLPLVSYGLYRNATSAALAYAERLRTAFDLYRWKVTEELRFDPPATLAAERLFWCELSRFLHRGATPDPEAVRYVRPKTDT